MPSNDDLMRTYRAATEPPGRASCPDTGLLVEMALGGRVDEAVVTHMSDCSACAEEVLAIREAAPATARGRRETAAAPLSRMAVAALVLLTLGLGGWSLVLLDRTRGLEARLAATPIGAKPEPVQSLPFEPAVAGSPPIAYINTPIIDLEPPGGAARGSAVILPAVELPAADAYSFVLSIDPEPEHKDFAIEVVGPGGEVVWESRGLRRSADDTFTFVLERRLFSSGVHRIELLGLDGSSRKRIASHPVRIPAR